MNATDNLVEIASEFRKGLLEDGPADYMCFAVCAPLQAYLSAICGVESQLEKIDFPDINHYWLRLADGRILDPTADQFPDAGLPAVYLGEVPPIYEHWIQRAKAGDRYQRTALSAGERHE